MKEIRDGGDDNNRGWKAIIQSMHERKKWMIFVEQCIEIEKKLWYIINFSNYVTNKYFPFSVPYELTG